MSRCLSALAAALLLSVTGVAQPTKPVTTTGDDEATDRKTIILEPFLTKAERDGGYGTANSLTGSGINQSLLDVPVNVNVLNYQFLQDVAPINLVAALQSGVSGVNARGTGLDDFFIRGFRVISPMRDGIPMYSNAKLPMYDIERIEVLKGPAGLLYGQASYIGGIVNMVSRQPSSTPSTLLKLGIGSYNYYDASLNVTGPVPIGAKDELSFRLTLAENSMDGQRDYEFEKTHFSSLGMRWKISESSTLDLDAVWYVRKFNDVYTVLDADGKIFSPKGEFSSSQPWGHQTHRVFRPTLSLRTFFRPGFQMKLTAQHQHNDDKRLQSYESAITNPDRVTMNQSVYLFDDKENYDQVNLDLLSQLTTGPIDHKLLYGAEYIAEYDNLLRVNKPLGVIKITDPKSQRVLPDPSAIFTAPAFTPVTNPYTRLNNDQFGAYWQYQANTFHDRLILVGGSRYYNQHSLSQTLSPTGSKATQGNDIWVSRYGAVVKLYGEELSAYFNHSESWTFISGILVDGSLARPSIGGNDEVGMKLDLMNHTLRGSVAFFKLTQDNVLRTIGPSQNVQDLELTSNGFEADVTKSFILPNGRFDGSITYYNAETLDQNKARALYVPKEQYGLTAKYAVTSGTLNSGYVGVNYLHMGDRPGPTNILVGYNYPWMGSYDTVNLFAGFTYGKVRLQLNVDNLFDETYINDGIFAFRIHTGQPRSARLSAEYSF